MIGRMLVRAALSGRPASPQPVKPWPLGGRLIGWAVITGLVAPYWRIALIVIGSAVLVLPLAVLIGKRNQGKPARQADPLEDVIRQWNADKEGRS